VPKKNSVTVYPQKISKGCRSNPVQHFHGSRLKKIKSEKFMQESTNTEESMNQISFDLADIFVLNHQE
jgi:hypothetical protein